MVALGATASEAMKGEGREVCSRFAGNASCRSKEGLGARGEAKECDGCCSACAVAVTPANDIARSRRVTLIFPSKHPLLPEQSSASPMVPARSRAAHLSEFG